MSRGNLRCVSLDVKTDSGRAEFLLAKQIEPTLAEPTEVDFDDSVLEIEAIVRRLESGELTLSESMMQYESAIGKMRQCYSLLESAERKISLLAGFDADGHPLTEPLDETPANETLTQKQKARSQRRSAKPSASEAS